jgi:APA family basic amino acid/polyamine antiporter
MWSGVGLVIANMVGVGVLLSAGFMAQELGPGGILLSWIVGATIALSGALAYGQLAILSGRSGGEYRYLHDYMHPYLGYLAGWASLLIGFSAPIAIAAFAAGAFLNKLGWPLTPQATGTLVIAAMTLAHGIHLSWSRSLQNVLVAVKFTFVLSFIAVGLLLGSKVWPAWTAPLAGPGPPVRAFLENDVARALTLGCLIVGCAYLLINWVFVANLTPDQAIAVADHEATQITLAHLVMTNIAGESGAAIVSSVIVVVLLSAISAMTLVGPRVYASMADDGLLPALLRHRGGKPPSGALLVQGGVALFLLHTQTVLDVVMSASAVLMVFSMLTVLTLFNLGRRGRPVRAQSIFAAVIYVLAVIAILSAGITSTKAIVLVLAAIVTAGTVGYAMALRAGDVRAQDRR